MMETPVRKEQGYDAPIEQEPPAPTGYAVFALDRRTGAKVQITKMRQRENQAKFDKEDLVFTAESAVLVNRLVVDEIL